MKDDGYDHGYCSIRTLNKDNPYFGHEPCMSGSGDPVLLLLPASDGGVSNAMICEKCGCVYVPRPRLEKQGEGS
jgi:hypothetical protein